MKNQQAPDQTQFISEELLLEQSQPYASADDNELPTERKKISPVMLVIIGAVILIIVGIVFALQGMSGSSTPAVIEPESSSTVTEPELAPLLQRLNELRSELRAADPSQDEYPLPPLNMSLTVEELK